MIGNVCKVWIGFAKNSQVRQNAASGGIITGSLLGLLRQNKIDGTVVTIPDFPHGGKSIFARKEKDLIQSAGSIYCVTSLKHGLKLAKESDTKSFAVVGLPCQIAKLESNKHLYATFGIMCGHNILPEATFKALRDSDIEVKNVNEVIYRAVGWFPYGLQILMKNGDVKNIPYDGSQFQKVWESKKYQPPKCLKCTDFAAEKADIACCDAWLEEYRGNPKGISIVLAHTQHGVSVIEHLIKTKILDLFESDESVLYRANMKQIEYKKRMRL
ncbi:Coenzyme F420 hydrogenase/dehydrogenase, beta subunit C-terminal domain [Candidatus Babeliales bacterium]|nr:Coenzyme F420 hydrogenase/dehydrogenase, beta subunit C-terminal domain [Candidatus Babeliales bacterium]